MMNINAKKAIYASISSGAHTLDERYIMEKLKLAAHVDPWLMYNIQEAKLRNENGHLGMQQMQALNELLNNSHNLFEHKFN